MAEDTPSQSEVAADFGYSLAFFKSDPELYTLLKSATSGSWSASRFVASLQNTKWFRTKSESYRKYIALQQTDPATFRQQRQAAAAHIMTLGGQMGVEVTGPWAQKYAETAMMMGWTDEQLRGFLSTKLTVRKGQYLGQAGALQREVNELAGEYGVAVGQGWTDGVIRRGVLGKETSESLRAKFQQLASSKYVALKDRIMAGETVRQIADPYMQSYAKLLEINGENIDIDDPLIQRALQAKGPKGVPTTQTLYEFEQGLRNDKRWAKTQNAQNQMSAVAADILRSFGLLG